MAQKLKVVFDTNVYISAAINPSGPSEAWLRIADRQGRSFNLYTSEVILAEITEKLTDKFGVAPQQVKQFTDAIREVATVVKPKHTHQVVAADPDDNILFGCAVEAKAQLIVTSDKQVLKVSFYKDIGICRPADLKNIFAQDLKYL
jgi:putative PIN family toxin of toxin-antitoxin system